MTWLNRFRRKPLAAPPSSNQAVGIVDGQFDLPVHCSIHNKGFIVDASVSAGTLRFRGNKALVEGGHSSASPFIEAHYGLNIADPGWSCPYCHTRHSEAHGDSLTMFCPCSKLHCLGALAQGRDFYVCQCGERKSLIGIARDPRTEFKVAGSKAPPFAPENTLDGPAPSEALETPRRLLGPPQKRLR
jgi:hypothetical protein